MKPELHMKPELFHNDVAAAERAILGAALVMGSLPPIDISADDFSDSRHRLIFGAMVELQEQSAPIDLVTLRAALANNNAASGGAAYIASLVDVLPPVANLIEWSRLVRAESSRIRLLTELSAAFQGMSYDEIVTHANVVLAKAPSSQKSFHQIKDLVKNTFKTWERMATTKGVTGLRTGINKLDEILGGLHGGELIVVAARPGLGKSSLATQITRSSCARSLIVSLEMDSEAIVRRIIASDARVNQRSIPLGPSKSQWEALAAASIRAYDLPIWISRGARTVGAIRHEARQIPKLGLVVVDYMQLMEHKAENRQAQVAGISRGLKALAQELDIPVVALSQLSRPAERKDRHRPQLTDLRESGAIEQDADVVILIYREEVHNPTELNQGRAELIVAKQRDGDTGIVKLNWEKTTTRFFEDEPQEQTL